MALTCETSEAPDGGTSRRHAASRDATARRDSRDTHRDRGCDQRITEKLAGGEPFARLLAERLEAVAGEADRERQVLDGMLPPIDVLADHATEQVLWNARARADALAEFGALTATQIAALRRVETSNPHPTVSRWLKEGRVFAVSSPQGRQFPTFQFDDGTPRPVIARVLAALHGQLRGWELLLWFTGSSGFLDGARPVDLLASDPDAVVDAAAYQASLSEDSILAATRSPDHPSTTSWAAGQTLWRVSKDLAGLRFTTYAGRRGRFSPVYGPDGETVVPSWYGATTREGAVFESVFHDIRPSDRAPRVQPHEYLDRFLAPVVPVRQLMLVDLTVPGLHAIGLSRGHLLESRSRRYPWTNEVARRLRAGAPAADGFVWVSRAHDTSMAVVLYADPGRDPIIDAHPSEVTEALGLGPGLRFLRELAIKARISIVLPDR